jgi:hypothetical protein
LNEDTIAVRLSASQLLTLIEGLTPSNFPLKALPRDEWWIALFMIQLHITRSPPHPPALPLLLPGDHHNTEALIRGPPIMAMLAFS